MFSNSTNNRSFLFVAGNARSGTTALANALNAHEDVLIGVERFNGLFVDRTASPGLFSAKRFFDFQENDQRKAKPRVIDTPENRAKFDSVNYVGDKVPSLHKNYEWFFDTFPGARVIYIVRNPFSVAESYEKRKRNPSDSFERSASQAIVEWNRSVSNTISAINDGKDITVVTYERLFSNIKSIKNLYENIGLDKKRADIKKLRQIMKMGKEIANTKSYRKEHIRFDVSLNAEFEIYQELSKYCALKKFDAGLIGATAPSASPRGRA